MDKLASDLITHCLQNVNYSLKRLDDIDKRLSRLEQGSLECRRPMGYRKKGNVIRLERSDK